jgi:enolase
MKIRTIRALEILDSRGNPTVQAEVELTDGTRAKAQVPSGASTGRHEAPELRDGDPARYGGKGVRHAVENVERMIAPLLHGLDASEQAAVDGRMLENGGCGRFGANAVLAVSCGAARAASVALGVPLWKHLAAERTPAMPVPMVNILSGGLHAGRNIEFQDFLVIARRSPDLATSLERIVRVHREACRLLAERGCVLTGVADEGGWGPRLESNEAAAAVLREAIERAGADMDIALDVAATHFHADGRYTLEGRTLDAAGMSDLLAAWVPRYGIASIEDALAEDDWDGWRVLTSKLGGSVKLVGDDLFTTNPERLRRGIVGGVANSVLVKMNQIGTLTQTFEVVRMARAAGYGVVVSARSGETEDSFLADLAVACAADHIKIGSITRSERLAKYNRLLEIERFELPAGSSSQTSFSDFTPEAAPFSA